MVGKLQSQFIKVVLGGATGAGLGAGAGAGACAAATATGAEVVLMGAEVTIVGISDV